MAASQPKNELADVIRAAIVDSGLNRAELASRSEIYYSAMHGCAAGTPERQLSLDTKLCRTLGLELRLVAE